MYISLFFYIFTFVFEFIIALNLCLTEDKFFYKEFILNNKKDFKMITHTILK